MQTESMAEERYVENCLRSTVYSGYSGHVYSGHSDIVATFPGTKCIHYIIFRSDIVAIRI